MIPFRDLIIVIVVLTLTCGFHHYMQRLAFHTSESKHINTGKLYDRLMEWTIHICKDSPLCKQKKNRLHISDTITQLLGFLLFIWVIFKSPQGVGVRYGYIIAVLFILRSITFNLTLLPSPNKHRSISLFHGGCNDLLFSGHYVWVTLFIYTLWKYTPVGVPLRILVTLIGFGVMPFFTLSNHSHYSIDIFLSVLLTYLVAFRING